MSRHGFTLIELLIVVAIIAILAAIAVPNFLEAQTRAKVSRFMADMRGAATAMESYAVDNNKYPPPDGVPAGSEAPLDPDDAPEAAAEGYLPRRLTTPIAYITSLPIDIFTHHEGIEGHPRLSAPHYVNDQYNMIEFAGDVTEEYFVARTRAGLRLQGEPPVNQYDRSAVWLIHSHGPDGDHDDWESEQARPTQYDPTNGTISDGDIFYFGPGHGFTK